MSSPVDPAWIFFPNPLFSPFLPSIGQLFNNYQAQVYDSSGVLQNTTSYLSIGYVMAFPLSRPYAGTTNLENNTAFLLVVLANLSSERVSTFEVEQNMNSHNILSGLVIYDNTSGQIIENISAESLAYTTYINGYYTNGTYITVSAQELPATDTGNGNFDISAYVVRQGDSIAVPLFVSPLQYSNLPPMNTGPRSIANAISDVLGLNIDNFWNFASRHIESFNSPWTTIDIQVASPPVPNPPVSSTKTYNPGGGFL